MSAQSVSETTRAVSYLKQANDAAQPAVVVETVNNISTNTAVPGSQPLVGPVETLLKRPLLNEAKTAVNVVSAYDTTSAPPTKIFITSTGVLTSVTNTTMVNAVGSTKTLTIATPGGAPTPSKLPQGTPTKIAIPSQPSLKSPTKITMIPIGKSPQRIAPAPGQTLMLTKSIGASGSGPSNVPNTITMSPSKVIIKQQTAMNASQSNQTLKQFMSAGTTLQGIQVPGKNFPYVRLVATHEVKAGQKMNLLPTPIQAKPLASGPGVPQSQVRITVPVVQSGQQQRLLLPATSGVKTISSTSGIVTSSSLPTAILSSLQGYQQILLPYVPNQTSSQVSITTPATKVTSTAEVKRPERSTGEYIPIRSNDPALSTLIQQSVRHHGINGQIAEATGARPRKPCNCTKSQCLKLYCDCFANGEFCHNCNCTNCANNIGHEEERSKAIKSCLDRNPNAFHPKIGKGQPGEGDRRHQKGCNCKRSGCLKNYCECYEAKIMCSSRCKCSGCKNFEESPDRKTLMHLADAAEVRVQQQTIATTKLATHMPDFPSRPSIGQQGERLPYTFVTQEVCEAAVSCLLAQAEEAERGKQSEANTHALILAEFGRCISQIIESANLTRAATSSPPPPPGPAFGSGSGSGSGH